MKRFKGAIIALVALAVVAIAVIVVDARQAREGLPQEIQPTLFRFEEEDLVGIEVVRPDLTLHLMRADDGAWSMEGRPFRPRRSMVRRVAHQLHDLNARTQVVEAPESLEEYGLGEGAIRVTLSLAGGQTLAFEAGDPNPTGVSYYIRPLPGDTVYTVKKSAVDYYRLDLEQFREHRFASLDADLADSIDAEVDGRVLRFHRSDEGWLMTEPEAWDASRQEVRTMLGRTGALKATAYVADQPEDLSPWGLDAPRHTVRIGLSTGDAVTLYVGDLVPDTDPAERYVYRVEDDAVYAAREDFLEAFRLPVVQYRRRDVLGLHEWDLAALTLTREGRVLRITRTADGWRWPDGSHIPGSTPRRVATKAADLQVHGFHDEPPEVDPGLEVPWATLELEVAETGAVHVVRLGAVVPEAVEDLRFVAVDDRATLYEVESDLAEVVGDLEREYARKLERDAEKNLELDEEAP